MNNLHDLPTSPQDPLDQRTAWLGGGDEFERKTEKSWKRRVVCLFFVPIKMLLEKIYHQLLVFILSIILFGCNHELSQQNEVQYGVASPTLSNDNSQILFTLCNIPGKCNIAFYDIDNDKLTSVNYTNNSDIGGAVTSRDGNMLTFTSGEGDDRNIFIVNRNGTDLRQLTHTYNSREHERNNGVAVVRINGDPSFSPDRKKILFVRSGVRRTRSMEGEMLSHWDVYELEIATGRERRLTTYEFYAITRPFYLSDGKRFIFSGYGPQGISEEDLRNLNTIRLMDGLKNSLAPPFQHTTWASSPTIADDGTIVFVSRTNEMDGTKGNYTYDLFVHHGGTTRRLTTMRYTIITEPFLSLDGQFVVYLASRTKEEGPSIWLARVDGTETKHIGMPWKRLK